MYLNNRWTGKDATKPRALGLLGHSVLQLRYEYYSRHAMTDEYFIQLRRGGPGRHLYSVQVSAAERVHYMHGLIIEEGRTGLDEGGYGVGGRLDEGSGVWKMERKEGGREKRKNIARAAPRRETRDGLGEPISLCPSPHRNTALTYNYKGRISRTSKVYIF